MRKVEIPAEYISRIQQKKLDAVALGWEARRQERISRTQSITDTARQEVKELFSEPLWLVGVTLYWAEGHKEKSWRTGALVTFTNMDENTIIIFKNWCRRFLGVKNDNFVYSLYIHDSRKTDSAEIQEWWEKKLIMSPGKIVIYYKKSSKKRVRHNDAKDYHGVLRVRVKKSVDMNRGIASWTSELVRSLKFKNELASG